MIWYYLRDIGMTQKQGGRIKRNEEYDLAMTKRNVNVRVYIVKF